MTIAVLGSNGKTGRVFIEAALQHGHTIIAAARQDPHDARTTFMACDATNPEDVARVIHDADAVVSLIGHGKGSSPQLHIAATQAIISAMQSSRPKRYISLTGTGVRMPGDLITFQDRILTLGIQLADPARLTDGRAAAKILETSDIPYTLVRVAKLTNRTPTSSRLCEHGPAQTFVPRVTVANLILDILESETHIRQMPIIATAQRAA